MKKIMVCILCLFLLTGCQPVTGTAGLVDPAEVLAALSAPELGGRRAGTDGNKRAGEYIASLMEQIGLTPWKEGQYYVPYTHAELSPDEIALAVTFADGTSTPLIFGSEFAVNSIMNSLDVTLPAVFSVSEQDTAFALFTDDADVYSLPGHPESLILKRVETLHYNTNYAADKQVISQYNVNVDIRSDIYDELMKKDPVSVKFTTAVTPLEFTAHNIVGVLPGTDRSRAIVFGAHFDGAGNRGDVELPCAYDNASGVAALLTAAAKLANASEKNAFAVDIVICAFNGEENSLQGSRAFSSEINNTYSDYLVVNIDCVGGAGCGPLAMAVHKENSAELKEAICRVLSEHAVPFDNTALPPGGDHLSFPMDIAAINLTQDNVFAVAHNANDRLENVDVDEVYKVAEAIFHLCAPLSS